ncbi:MAG: Flp pilus assembly complex ATPase component TadA, partial [Planctomycetaceae bacterium]|nr:Flp pilus assembly complex ATPase component TadA [Planctomycetaceae bacterium]
MKSVATGAAIGDRPREANGNLAEAFASAMQQLDFRRDSCVPELVTIILSEARRHHASDIHLVPQLDGIRMMWRIDGVLHPTAVFGAELGPRLIARLKVISGLLTYRTDIPQEGRVSREYCSSEIRVTTFPTLHGEKRAIRLFAESNHLQRVAELGFSDQLQGRLQEDLQQTAGIVLISGPSGSGKTTTAYACLRDVITQSIGHRALMTLEDPIEVAVEGVSQSQVRPPAGFDLPTGLRSLMRQDPDVIML